MSKIVAAANSMLANQKKINSVVPSAQSTNEIFFVYDNKFAWSITHYNDNYALYFYPGENIDVENLSNTLDWDSIKYVTYSTDELRTREAYDTFAELYTVIKEKLLGVDEVLDEIIGDLF